VEDTMATTPSATFLSLPIELRLQIAAYALEQPENVSLSKEERFRGTELVNAQLDPDYYASQNLSLLLVCHQFHHDFSSLAYRMTTFVVAKRRMQAIKWQPAANIRNLRKLVLDHTLNEMLSWHNYPFDNESLHLDELCLFIDLPNYKPLTRLLRRLQNVKTFRIFHTAARPRIAYARLVAAMQKDDHFQRYDAPCAPDIGCTWWDASYNAQTISFDLVAQEPVPLMAEEDYMVMMKPSVDELMEWFAEWL
jgi:hypothetical protein